MKNTFSLTKQITSTSIDYENKMRFDTLLSSFQDVAIFHSNEMGVGFYDFLKSSNAIWVLTKVKLYAPKMPMLTETVKFSTYPTDISALRFIREFTASGDMGGIAVGHSEWCVLDATTKSLRKANSLNYPFNLERRTDNVGLEFDNMRYEATNLVYTYKVKLTDIDCNMHTNNVAYARMALNAFDLNEYSNYNFNAFEIKFASQSYYGNEIEIYKNQIEENKVFITGRIKDKCIFSALLSKEKNM
ncbi:MAG: hypothetical protein J6Q38_00520 [Clostridia bacterium]|nr:hypothetical protein [Clostridia bacterium]